MMPGISNAAYELVPIGALRTHPANPRQGDIGAICESIRENGFFGAVTVQRSTGYILAGNHRFMAARELGLAVVPCVWVDVDDDRALRILLADNKTSDDASYNEPALAALLADLANTTDKGLAGTGFSGDELDDLIGRLNAPATPPESKPKAEKDPGQYGVIVICQDEEEQEHVYQRIVEMGWLPRKSMVSERSKTTLG